jgi:hypothetical protein
VNGIMFTGQTNTLTYPMLLTLLKHKYGGASATGANAPIIMTLTYGSPTSGKYTGATQNLVGFDGTTTSIRVVISNFNFPIDVTDSKEGYLPIASMTLLETA